MNYAIITLLLIITLLNFENNHDKKQVKNKNKNKLIIGGSKTVITILIIAFLTFLFCVASTKTNLLANCLKNFGSDDYKQNELNNNGEPTQTTDASNSDKCKLEFDTLGFVINSVIFVILLVALGVNEHINSLSRLNKNKDINSLNRLKN